MDEQRYFNPYAPPKARLEQMEPAEPETSPGERSAAPYLVPAVNGLMWWWQAGRLFVERPIFWTLVLGLFAEVQLRWGIENMLPTQSLEGVIGIDIDAYACFCNCLSMALFGSAAFMAHRQSESEPVHFLDIVTCFRQPFRQLPNLLLIVPVSALLSLPALAITGLLAALYQAGFADISFAKLDAAGGVFFQEHPLLSAAVFSVFYFLPYSLILFLAPALVMLASANVFQAAWRGLRAGLRNWLALLVNLLLPTLLALQGLHLFADNTGTTFSGPESFFLNTLTTGIVIVLPLVGYAAARDMFYNEE